MKKIFNVIFALAAVLGATQCNVSELDSAKPQPGTAPEYEQIHIRFTSEKSVKSNVQEEGTDLKFYWEEGDKLYVYDGEKFCGTMDLNPEDIGKEAGRFEGTVSVPASDTYRFFYFGSSLTAPQTSSLTVDFSSQDGELETLEKNIISSCEDEYEEGKTEYSGTFKTAFAIGKFIFKSSDFVEGAKIHAQGLRSVVSVSTAGEITYGEHVEEDYTYLLYENEDPVFIAMPSCEDDCKLSFYNADYTKIRSYTKSIENGVYYRTSEPVPFEPCFYVKTMEPAAIYAKTASSGGAIFNADALTIAQRGICWCLASSGVPTLENCIGSTTDYEYQSGSFTPKTKASAFTGFMPELQPGTEYNVRAYAKVGEEVTYDREYKTFTTFTLEQVSKRISSAGVDMGFYVEGGVVYKEGVEGYRREKDIAWAEFNMGADSDDLYGYGDYYMWGENACCTTTDNTWQAYRFSKEGGFGFTVSDAEKQEFVKYLSASSSLDAVDDAAQSNWGKGWRMPTPQEIQALIDNSDVEKVQISSKWVYKFTSKLYKSEDKRVVYFPCAGYKEKDGYTAQEESGYYLTSSLSGDAAYNATAFSVGESVSSSATMMRACACAIRPVRKSPLYYSVSPTKKVLFAPGNLQYQASTDTWRFAEHQWDFVGDETYGNVKEGEVKSNNKLASATYEGWIDLFGWGANNFTDPYSKSTTPWEIAYDDNKFHPDYQMTGLGSIDWGNIPDIKGDDFHTYFTLSYNEWEYLLAATSSADTPASGIGVTSSRDRANQLCGICQIDGVRGVIIAPDQYSGVIPNGGVSVSIEDWAKLEDFGCVFLPNAGVRSTTTGDNNVQSFEFGWYWSSTAHTTWVVGTRENPTHYVAGSIDFGYNQYLITPSFIPDPHAARMDSYSVRLVREVEL